MNKTLDFKIDRVTLEGELVIPEKPNGLVIFSHGSGSSRFSPRNNFVAQFLQKQRFGTFLFDLLTRQEDRVYHNRFNISLLSQRLADVTRHLIILPEVKELPLGYFGASTGAASAIDAASALATRVGAIVCRGGRPDLAENLESVKAPTLLIVGELDYPVIELNQKALTRVHVEKELKIVKGATHLFEEPGTLEEVAQLSADWFAKHLSTKPLLQLREITDSNSPG